MYLSVAVVLILFHYSIAWVTPSPETDPLVIPFVENCLFARDPGPDVRIYQMEVRTAVSNRFAHTAVISKLVNCGNGPKEATFSVVLPDSAFVSGFAMEIGGRNYTAYVEERKAAKEKYREAVARGIAAGHVAVAIRDSNQITISVNVDPQADAVFYLTYEELLQRKNSHYEVVINLRPGQVVSELSVEVDISESLKITHLKAIPLRTGNEITSPTSELDPNPFVQTLSESSAKVAFSPSAERQMQFAQNLQNSQSLSCQFVVQYDVEREAAGGDVLIEDGYFVHFFAPSQLPHMPKHVVFILDTSSSMNSNAKLQQLKTAMSVILSELNKHDVFHLVEFKTKTYVWVLDNPPSKIEYDKEDTQKIMMNYQRHKACEANQANIQRAKTAVNNFRGTGATDVNTALRIGLRLIQYSKLSFTGDTYPQPMIIFLTDGDPTKGETDTSKIVREVTKLNNGLDKTPIFALSLGNKPNKAFLRKLSLNNRGFPKHIYEAADASLQLENFYQQISSLSLSDVAFRYESSVKNLTETRFPLHFSGSELVTAGRYDPAAATTSFSRPAISAWNGEENISLPPTVHQSTSNIERLWAYLTVKQLLQRRDNLNVDKQDLNRRALDLSLKYSFVTPVTSLVVVKPDENTDVDIVTANENTDVDAVTASETSHNTNISPYGAPSAIDFSFLERVGDVSYNSSDSLRLKNNNGILDLPEGMFKLGLNETIADIVPCKKSLLNSRGHCRLLHTCLSDSLSIRVDDYMDHFCQLGNGYAGICCPDHWYKEY